MKQQGIPGMTVALAKNGTMLYAQAYGDSDIATHSATQTSTIFEIGSITKQFTAALIMKLQEQGELHVDDSISAYLPDYKFPTAITLRMLLTHTLGFGKLHNFRSVPRLGHQWCFGSDNTVSREPDAALIPAGYAVVVFQ
jgi:D-alanyl-D-alanine carboxypeptidase